MEFRPSGRTVVITGAGISAPSGIATYRAGGSSWTDPRLESISQASRYGNHLPELWTHWGQLKRTMKDAVPNPAHLALAEAQLAAEAAGGSLIVATQNIDALHARAGSTTVVELHGSLFRSRCIRKTCIAPFEDDTIPEAGEVPRCEKCGRPLRPDVVLFGEILSSGMLRRLEEQLEAADLCVYIGTSGEVWPVSDLVMVAARKGARCVLINAEPWEHPHPSFHETVIGPAEELVPGLFAV